MLRNCIDSCSIYVSAILLQFIDILATVNDGENDILFRNAGCSVLSSERQIV